MVSHMVELQAPAACLMHALFQLQVPVVHVLLVTVLERRQQLQEHAGRDVFVHLAVREQVFEQVRALDELVNNT